MNIIEQDILFADELFTLTNQRALIWKQENCLIISDIHIGKAAHFRKNGIALPRQATLDDLQRLEKLTKHYRPQKVIIVGDLVHAGFNSEVALFREWASQLAHTEFMLVKGNHDHVPEEQLKDVGINKIHDQLEISGIVFVHQSLVSNSGFEIAGHVHPGIRIKTPTSYARLPCFVVTEKRLILPAFSRFTGLDLIHSHKNATYYAIAEEGIFQIKQN